MNRRHISVTLIFFIYLFSSVILDTAPANSEKNFKFGLNPASASQFAKMALRCIEKEYPNKPSHVMNSNAEIFGPKEMHPAFYGCFDWHSSVHGHWMLVRILKKFPDLKIASRIRAALNRNLTKKNIDKEVEYFGQKNRKSFERTYGWAWLLKLAEELHGWEDQDGKKWSKNLKVLEEKIVKNFMEFLPKQIYPIRTGVHPNTAFGLVFAYDYAIKTKNSKFLEMIRERSLSYFKNDSSCPDNWEPSGEDFLSPCLEEADLMIRILGKKEFKIWFKKFLPNLTESKIMIPAEVSDRSDGKLSHLDGLNLSRAWCLADLLKIFRDDANVQIKLKNSIKKHAESTLRNIRSGHYAGEHWLGSFAVYMYSRL